MSKPLIFQPVEGAVVLCSNGVYKEAALAEIDGKVFAQTSNGYVRIKEYGRTSHPKIFWGELQLDQEILFDMGSAVIKDHTTLPLPKSA